MYRATRICINFLPNSNYEATQAQSKRGTKMIESEEVYHFSLPHDHGFYGPTSKAIFKKQFVERNFGLIKRPSLNTPLIKVRHKSA